MHDLTQDDYVSMCLYHIDYQVREITTGYTSPFKCASIIRHAGMHRIWCHVTLPLGMTQSPELRKAHIYCHPRKLQWASRTTHNALCQDPCSEHQELPISCPLSGPLHIPQGLWQSHCGPVISGWRGTQSKAFHRCSLHKAPLPTGLFTSSCLFYIFENKCQNIKIEYHSHRVPSDSLKMYTPIQRHLS